MLIFLNIILCLVSFSLGIGVVAIVLYFEEEGEKKAAYIKYRIMALLGFKGKEIKNAEQARKEYNTMLQIERRNLRKKIANEIKESNKKTNKTACIFFGENNYDNMLWAEEHLSKQGYDTKITADMHNYEPSYKLEISW